MGMDKLTIKVLGKLFDAGHRTEKDIQALETRDVLKLPGISVQEIGYIEDLKEAIKKNRVISFMAAVPEKNSL